MIRCRCDNPPGANHVCERIVKALDTEWVAAWQRDRNRNHAGADWHFRTEMPVSNSSTSTLHFE
jgi:hypothetical protein